MTVLAMKYQCPICNVPYMHKSGVERHIKLTHSLPDGNPTVREPKNFLRGN